MYYGERLLHGILPNFLESLSWNVPLKPWLNIKNLFNVHFDFTLLCFTSVHIAS